MRLGTPFCTVGLRALKRFMISPLFDESSVYEYEANIFAADYLMGDEEVLALLNDDLSFFGAASRLQCAAGVVGF